MDAYSKYNVHYGAIKKYDVANGEGVRVSLFLSGCVHHCKGCFQPETWNPEYGELYTEETEEEILTEVGKDWITGLSILGGDPLDFNNPYICYYLIKHMKERYPNKDVWLYTGDIIPSIVHRIDMINKDPFMLDMLLMVDVLVEGPFIESMKSLMLKFMGSSNQRLLTNKEFVKLMLQEELWEIPPECNKIEKAVKALKSTEENVQLKQ